MFQEMLAMSSGGGGDSGYTLIDDITSVKCVASVNPSGYSKNLSLQNIPKTENVMYILANQSYQTTFVVGTNYNLKNYNNSALIVLDDNGVQFDFSTYNYTLSGTTLSTSQSATYSNYGLFILGEK